MKIGRRRADTFVEKRYEKLVAETDKAWLVDGEDFSEPRWVAKSQGDIDVDSRAVFVSTWLLGKWAEEDASR